MLYAVLLAGGKSSRMGQDKALLEINNQSLLQRALRLLESVGAERVLLSGDLEGYDCIADLLPDRGPLGGVYSTLDHIHGEFGLDGSPLLVVPVDMPLLNAEVLKRLLVSCEKAQCCHYRARVFPCLLRASADLLEYLKALHSNTAAAGENRSMHGLMAGLDTRVLEPGERADEVFMNVNCPEDWELIRRKIR